MIPSVQVLTSTAYTNTTTTASNVGGLSMFLTANGLYRFHGAGTWAVNSLTGTPTVGLRLSGDGNLNAAWIAQRWTIESNATGGVTSTLAYAALAPTPGAVTPAAVATYAWECSGLIRVNTSGAGVLSIQAQLRAGTGTLTIGTGSVLLVEQLG